MEIEILEFAEGARNSKGLAVIIDVFRAFSVSCYASDAGAVRIFATATDEEAFRLKGKYPGAVLAGEKNERKIEGFDLGNSPTEILKTDIRGKTVVQTTTAGTNGLINAINADIVITGSLVNAEAIVRYIKSVNPENVSLVAMGYRGCISAEEDLLCAELISDGIKGTSSHAAEKIPELRTKSGRRFFEQENIDFSPPTDFFLCIMKDRFNFILKAERRSDSVIELIRIDMM
jgi:2-phosphosulfolactate phosphatase